jgi:hypothetical protein
MLVKNYKANLLKCFIESGLSTQIFEEALRNKQLWVFVISQNVVKLIVITINKSISALKVSHFDRPNVTDVRRCGGCT